MGTRLAGHDPAPWLTAELETAATAGSMEWTRLLNAAQQLSDRLKVEHAGNMRTADPDQVSKIERIVIQIVDSGGDDS